ncbi:hypothetical protein JHD48_07510 [Sulfurimonas sp. SAG-AH-194-I05]|nr:hypothetical protein [Sulfurimonas sp. SAG-AH-194-I05]MDF1875578.1 hypothetical protein [Sulfurimonas sp. SAG-AH-194-I05]
MAFDWKEYKIYKEHSSKVDKLAIAIDFLRSYYNMNNARDMFDVLNRDDIGQMMLAKRNISSAESLETFMFKV